MAYYRYVTFFGSTACLLLVCLSGCMGHTPEASTEVVVGNAVDNRTDKEKFDLVAVGMTRDDAEKILGKPSLDIDSAVGKVHYGNTPTLGKEESPYSPKTIIIIYKNGRIESKEFYSGKGS